ncbi:replication-associated protein [Vehemenivirus recresis]|uniref:Replication-associated protein n=1 Tax=Circovirus sp. TaxID=1964372 RepID=A0A2K9YN98_9CIRC|nr:replication-associated protein [Circovirus sp.]
MARHFCFTLNNYSFAELIVIESTKCEYIVCGAEICPTTGTRHIQGYVEFKDYTRLTTLSNKWPRAALFRRKGSALEAANYCKEDGDFWEKGIISPGQGFRGEELDRCRNMAQNGGMRMVTQLCNLQQIGVAKAFLTHNERTRDFKPNVIWIWGPTGTGKSRLARQLCADLDVYTKSDGSKWFDGYDAHAALILDDFRDSWMSFTDLLSILDRYERRIECKGGSRQLLASKIIITSCSRSQDFYKNAQEAIDQLVRRIDEVIYLGPAVAEVREVILEAL